MQKYDVSKFIMADLLTGLPNPEKPTVNRVLINNIVDSWSNKVYFQPRESIKINHLTPHDYNLM